MLILCSLRQATFIYTVCAVIEFYELRSEIMIRIRNSLLFGLMLDLSKKMREVWNEIFIYKFMTQMFICKLKYLC